MPSAEFEPAIQAISDRRHASYGTSSEIGGVTVQLREPVVVRIRDDDNNFRRAEEDSTDAFKITEGT